MTKSHYFWGAGELFICNFQQFISKKVCAYMDLLIYVNMVEIV